MQSLLIVLINQIIYVSENLNYLKSFLPLINLIILVLTVLVLFSIKGIGDNIKKIMEENLLKEHLKQVEGLVTTLQINKHEHARHIQTIQAMLYLEEINSAKEYINGISKTYRHSEDIVYVGNPALTALLNSKRQVAESNRIDFDFAIKCDITSLKMPPWDLCSIVGNLIDNAFEAVVKNNNDRNVGLEIKLEESKHIIYVYNNGAPIPVENQQLIFQEGYTTKTSKTRGYGLYLVKILVDQYEGKIEVRSAKKTVFIISFPIREVGGING